jgi:hypothetical protein
MNTWRSIAANATWSAGTTVVQSMGEAGGSASQVRGSTPSASASMIRLAAVKSMEMSFFVASFSLLLPYQARRIRPPDPLELSWRKAVPFEQIKAV